MTGKTPFDQLAEHYDSLFTRTQTGMAQRDIVRRYVKRRIFQNIEILEVNCGTGEDAFFLATLGCNVIATDASAEMISVCVEKASKFTATNSPIFERAAIHELSSTVRTKKFDLIFSDFSGLNCIDPMELNDTVRQFYSMLKTGGKMIFVLFGTNCLWEKFYFFLKGKNGDISRRKSKNPVQVKLMNEEINIWYYSPHELKKSFKNYFEVYTTRPVGLFIPPSYLDSYFHTRKTLFRILKVADKLFESFTTLSNLSDHYLIEFRKR